MEQFSARGCTKELFGAALKAVNPYKTVKHSIHRIMETYRTAQCQKIRVVGFGKASCPMMGALADSMEDLIDEAVVITKYGHNENLHKSKKIKVFEAGHPIPDESGLQASLRRRSFKRLPGCALGGGPLIGASRMSFLSFGRQARSTPSLAKR